MKSIKGFLLGLVGPLIRPVAKLVAQGAVKLVLLTKTTDDDALLREIAKAILDRLGEPSA